MIDYGLKPSEVVELLEYISKNNSWLHMRESHEKGYPTPKYTSFDYDVRTNTVWRVEFRNVVNGKDTSFRTESGYRLKERIYDWLKGDK